MSPMTTPNSSTTTNPNAAPRANAASIRVALGPGTSNATRSPQPDSKLNNHGRRNRSADSNASATIFTIRVCANRQADSHGPVCGNVTRGSVLNLEAQLPDIGAMPLARASIACLSAAVLLLVVRGPANWSRAFGLTWYGLFGAAVVLAVAALVVALLSRDAPKRRLVIVGLSLLSARMMSPRTSVAPWPET